jgi:uncharacterized protein (TIGR02145 family)
MNYTLKTELGRGGMAIVYLAEHQLLHNKVAIKLLNEDYVRNSNIRNRFLSEARNMARMSHPNIIKVNDLIDDGDTVAFVMEYIEGETLKDYLERKGKLGDEEIKTLFTQMLDAVGYVHEQKLVHRDIKPSNFMITPNGKVKLMDFGIAKNTDASSAEYTQTGTGMQMGTPMYMSPEQITETKSVTAQSDIYSLGVVLWQMVTGRKPYDTSTLSAFILQSKIVNEPLEKTETKWDKIISISTDKEINKRYSNCRIINEELIKNSNPIKNSKLFEDFDSAILKTLNELKVDFPSVLIGTQIWMKDNLNVERFQNGDLIQKAESEEEWIKISNNKKPCWCNYKFNNSIGVKYGKLYNYFAINDSRKLSPEGWTIPQLKDWMEMVEILGGIDLAGNKIRLTQKNNFNSTGFNAIPGGRFEYSRYPLQFNFEREGIDCQWWTFTSFDKNTACSIILKNKGDKGHLLEKVTSIKKNGYYVRCFKKDNQSLNSEINKDTEKEINTIIENQSLEETKFEFNALDFCQVCEGKGLIDWNDIHRLNKVSILTPGKCDVCDGEGQVSVKSLNQIKVSYEKLHEQNKKNFIIDFENEIKSGINVLHGKLSHHNMKSYVGSEISNKKIVSFIDKFISFKIEIVSVYWYFDLTVFGKGDDGIAIVKNKDNKLLLLISPFLESPDLFELIHFDTRFENTGSSNNKLSFVNGDNCLSASLTDVKSDYLLVYYFKESDSNLILHRAFESSTFGPTIRNAISDFWDELPGNRPEYNIDDI